MLRNITPIVLIGVFAFARPASADTPAGSFYLGVGRSWMAPLRGDQPGGIPSRNGQAWAFEVAVETERILGEFTFDDGSGHGSPDFQMASVRLGWILTASPFAPYVAGGLGWMSQRAIVSGESANGSGTAGIVELGVLLFRNVRFARAAVAIRLVQPFFDVEPPVGVGGVGSENVPVLLLTGRVFIGF